LEPRGQRLSDIHVNREEISDIMQKIESYKLSNKERCINSALFDPKGKLHGLKEDLCPESLLEPDEVKSSAHLAKKIYQKLLTGRSYNVNQCQNAIQSSSLIFSQK
jgi:hypothetical protein